MDQSYGIVDEVKKSLSSDESRWAKDSQQLRKYDDGLLGWWTESGTVAESNAVMLIHQSRGRAYVRHLETLKSTDGKNVGPNTAVVEFNRSDEGRAYIFFRKEWGEIRQAVLATRLNEGVQVPRDKVQESFPVVKFYDAPPPEEELLKTLWMDVFHASYNPSMALAQDGVHHMEVRVDDITNELQQAYGSQKLRRDSRSAEFPKKTWIKHALDRLVEFDLAAVGNEPGTYVVKYKPFPKGDVLERFCRLTRKTSVGSIGIPDQLPLPFSERSPELTPSVDRVDDPDDGESDSAT
jgi:hypothetical protein